MKLCLQYILSLNVIPYIQCEWHNTYIKNTFWLKKCDWIYGLIAFATQMSLIWNQLTSADLFQLISYIFLSNHVISVNFLKEMFVSPFNYSETSLTRHLMGTEKMST